MKRLIASALVGCLTVSVRAEVTTVLSVPPKTVAANSETEVALVFLNSGDKPASANAPANLTATLVSGNRRETVTLVSRDGGGPKRAIAPGAFVRVPYGLTLPRDLTGQVVVEVSSAGAATVMNVGGTGTGTGTAAAVAPPGATVAAPGATVAAPGNVPNTATGDPLGESAPAQRSGFVEYFARHFSGHEPTYFLIGPEAPNAKFQFSFKYQVFNEDGPFASAFKPLTGLHLAYSQTSFWDLESASKPFFDNSYRPEALVAYDSILPREWKIPGVARVGLQAGVQHESNGRDGLESRSLNIAYVRPIFVVGDEQDLFLTIAPRAFTYIGDLGDNPDIEDYRGYGDLRLVTGWANGLQLATIGRLGDDWDKGSLQFDLSYPLRRILDDNLDVYLHAQVFTGFGESLRDYDESDNTFRIGISLVR